MYIISIIYDRDIYGEWFLKLGLIAISIGL